MEEAMKRMWVILAAAGALAAAVSGASAEPMKLRISWAVAPAHLTPMIPLAPQGVYRHYGKSYVVEPVHIDGSGPALQALAAGEIEMGGLSAQALVLGVKRANLDLKVIAELMSSGVKGYADSDFYVRKGEIKKIEDLKGKTLAVNARGSTIDAAVRAITTRHGLEDGKDYQIVEVRFSSMLPSLESKRVDLAVLLQPFNLMAEKKGGFEVLFTMNDALGPTQTLQYVSRADWIAKNRNVLVDFFEDHLRFRRWLLDDKNRDAAVELVAKVTKRSPDAYKEWVFTKKDNYHDVDAISDTKLLQKNVEDLHKLDILPTTIEVEKHTDLSLIEEAKRRLTM
jgi:NitT/TauT family transport system substrate-binding protein